VVFVLPGWVPETAPLGADTPTAPAPASARAPAPPSQTAQHATERAVTDRALQAYLRSAARLELARAPLWGEPEWSEAIATAAEADRQYRLGEFAEAAAGYQRAQQRMRDLESQRQSRRTAALTEAQQALVADDAQTAQARFQLALAIDPERPEAARGLAMAKARPALLALMQNARRAEATGDLGAALDAYRQASEIDPHYPPASEKRDRVAAALREAAFRDAMSQALSALQQGRRQAAAEALQQAERLQPGDATLADVRERLRRERMRARLAHLRRDAQARASAEDWQAAAELYQQALQTAPNAGFAVAGLARARERQQIHQQLERYLNAPGRLQSPDPRANAERLLSAVNPDPDQPKLRQKLAQLERQLARARTPLPVLLHSDGETEVVVYHVGRLGRFHRRSLELRPGRYTAVGSRDGFRDVRREFSVQPGHPPAPVVVRCVEAL